MTKTNCTHTTVAIPLIGKRWQGVCTCGWSSEVFQLVTEVVSSAEARRAVREHEATH